MKFQHYDLLEQMVGEGFVSKQAHPTAPLFIYNYTPRAQYSRTWNEATLQARGLILDAQGEIVQRPFSKFFNAEELGSLPAEPFEVYEKLDGSLGVLHFVGHTPAMSMRLDSTHSFLAEATMMG